MKVLALHTHYLQSGGEDGVFAAEMDLLREKGHEVYSLTFHNRDLEGLPPLRQAAFTLWNREAYEEVGGAIRAYRPEIVHIHNTFPLASPSVVHAAKEEGVPVILTLHNYRLLCVNALFFREGSVCEDCLGRLPWRGVARACYRGSRATSGVVAAMLTVHRALGTWTRLVNVYIALTEFSRQKFIEGGLPVEKIVVKPNFVYPDPGVSSGQNGYALYVGRLSPEKGIKTLLDAWKRLRLGLQLKVVGDGPLAPEVSEVAKRTQGIEWLGRKPRDEVYSLMRRAAFLVLPSIVYENFPMAIAEAYASGLPVIASEMGTMASLVDHGRTGLHFKPGDPEDLAGKVEWLISHPTELTAMRKEARAEYEAKYTAERNYQILMKIYERAIETARQS